MMFVLSVRGKMMMGGCHYPADCVQEERNCFIYIIKSIQESKDVEEAANRDRRKRQ